ncbi:MAG: M20/M25/M40 family metallo-hydrolase [Holophagales bacterium]|nr:M20/M25/M40 family metallo-hydrolase [Holophagales bacterium]
MERAGSATTSAGRGTIDMKGQGIADFLAIASLRRDGLVPERDIVFVAEPGEETYSPQIGIGWVMDHRPDLLAGVTDVFNEGGVNEVSGDRIARFGIEVLQKAAIMATAEAAREEDLKAFSEFLEARMDAEPYQVLDEVQDFLAFVAPSRSDVWGHQMSDARAAVQAGQLGEEIPEPYRALMRDMYYSGKVLPAPGAGVSRRASWPRSSPAVRFACAGRRCRPGPPGTGFGFDSFPSPPTAFRHSGRGGPGRRFGPSSPSIPSRGRTSAPTC